MERKKALIKFIYGNTMGALEKAVNEFVLSKQVESVVSMKYVGAVDMSYDVEFKGPKTPGIVHTKEHVFNTNYTMSVIYFPSSYDYDVLDNYSDQ